MSSVEEWHVMYFVATIVFLSLLYYTIADLTSDDALDKGLRPVRTKETSSNKKSD